MKKVLVLHTWGMGDLIMATPMLQSLYESSYNVDIAITNTSSTIIENAPFINKIIHIEKLFDFFKLFKKYDIFVVTVGTNQKKVWFISKLLGVKELYSSALIKNRHCIDVNLDIVKPLINKVIYTPYIKRTYNKKIIHKYIEKDKKNIGFAIGSGIKQRFKRWEVENYAQLIKNFDENCLVFIGPDEQELEKELLYFGKFKIVREKLDKIIEIIANLDLLIGNDNGLMHIGYATNIKTLTIFGMTNEKEVGGYNKHNEAIFLPKDCRPCFDSSSKKVGCATLDCLKDLEVSKVLEKCQTLL